MHTQSLLLILKRSLVIFALLILSTAIVHAAMDNRRRLALVIGNGDYPQSRLKNPENDAEDIADKLESLGFDVMLHTDLARKQMRRVVRQFGRKAPNYDVILFYFAGHGVQLEGENYLIPVDVDFDIMKSELQDDAVRANTILDIMNEADDKTNIFILDACRNNPFRSFSRSASRGLATLESGVGTLIAYATAPGSTAEDGSGRNGTYTQYLLENLDKPGLTVEQMMKRVRIGVLKATRNRQVPWENSSLRGDFCFAGCETSEQMRARELAKQNRVLQEKLMQTQQQLKSSTQINQENVRLSAQIEKLKRNYQDVQLENNARVHKLTEIQKQRADLEHKIKKEKSSYKEQIALQQQLNELQQQKQQLEQKMLSALQANAANEEMLEELEKLKRENELLKQQRITYQEPVAAPRPVYSRKPRRSPTLMVSP